ncbi:MAG: glycoside hydrolase family 3 C-terminal domain-containing protein, partial [Turicibacter sp.]
MNESKIGVPLEGFAEFSRGVAAEGMVLLKNNHQMLPIKENEVLSVFGRCQINYYRSGTGSGGAVNVEYFVNALEGLRNNSIITINETLAKEYENWLIDHPFDNGGGGWAAEPWHQQEMPLTDEMVSAAKEVSEKAIVIIGRTAGEDQDNADRVGSYRLTLEEKAMLLSVTQHFEHVAVILNVSNIMDMSWVNDEVYQNRIDAILYAWHGGIEGGNALADVLSGQVTPSGKMSDTIAYRIEDYPSHANFGSLTRNEYQEDIYVGYRYFETFNPDAVQYEFGYGLSYTTFKINTTSVTVTGVGLDAKLNLLVEVINTGATYAGKEVVQVYYSAPQGKLGKPAKVLGAFAKTELLQPG